jgi:hypothetical protein
MSGDDNLLFSYRLLSQKDDEMYLLENIEKSFSAALFASL